MFIGDFGDSDGCGGGTDETCGVSGTVGLPSLMAKMSSLSPSSSHGFYKHLTHFGK